MKNMFSSLLVLSSLLIVSANANADSRLTGAWKNACSPANGGSTVNVMAFNADGTVVSTDSVYASADCSGTVVASQANNATYTVAGAETDPSISVSITTTGTVNEGQLIAATMQMTFSSPTQAQVKMTAAAVKVQGARYDLTAADLAQIPVVSVTKQ